MTTLFFSTIDDFTTTADLSKAFDVVGAWTYDPTGGIDGRGAVSCAIDDSYLQMVVSSPGDSPVDNLRFYYKFRSNAPESDYIAIFEDAKKGVKHYMRLTSSGRVEISGSDTATSVTYYTGLTNICDGSFHTIQGYIKAGTGAAGTIKVWVNNVLEIDRDGFSSYDDSFNDIVENFDKVYLGAPNTDGWIDDIIIWNDEASGLTGKIEGIPAFVPLSITGAGSSSDFTPSSGSNWENVDDIGANDDDITTVSSDTVGHKDYYTTSSLPASFTNIFGVFLNGYARAEEAASSSLRINLKSGPIEENGQTRTLNGASYQHIPSDFLLDPNTSLPWTTAAINTIEVGPEKT